MGRSSYCSGFVDECAAAPLSMASAEGGALSAMMVEKIGVEDAERKVNGVARRIFFFFVFFFDERSFNASSSVGVENITR